LRKNVPQTVDILRRDPIISERSSADTNISAFIETGFTKEV